MPCRSLLALPLLLLLVPASAQAAVTAAAVTTPPADARLFWEHDRADGDPANALSLAGTATAGPGDAVDVFCVRRAAGGANEVATAATSVPVRSGAFTASTSLARVGAGTCRLAAGPVGATPPSPLSAFPGPWLAISSLDATSDPADVAVTGASPTSGSLTRTAGAGGLQDAATISRGADGVPESSAVLWDGDGALPATVAGGARSAIRVDGVDAFTPASAAHGLPGLPGSGSGVPGLPALSVTSRTVDVAAGTLRVTTSEPIVVCSGGATATAATSATCDHFVPTGVVLRRETLVEDGGRSVSLLDRWASADGRAHQVDLQYRDAQRASADVAGYRLPWISGASYASYAAGAEPGPGPGDVATIYVKQRMASADAGDAVHPQGAITLSPRPARIAFSAPDVLQLGWQLALPGSGDRLVEQRFALSTSRPAVEAGAAELERRAAAALAARVPAVRITAPTLIGGFDPRLAIGGTVSAPDGVATLLVAGQSVAVGPDGHWSALIGLQKGANPVTAVLTDTFGRQAGDTASIAFTPGAAQLRFDRPSYRKGVLRVGVSCVGLIGTRCTARATLTGLILHRVRRRDGTLGNARGKRVSVLNKTFSVAAGADSTVKLKLGRIGLALVRKHRRLQATADLAQTIDGRTQHHRYSLVLKR